MINNFLLIVLSLSFSCSSDCFDCLRKYHPSDSLLEQGLVKKYRIKYSDNDFIDYEMLKKNNNEIQFYKIDSNFNIIRQEKLKIFPNYWEMTEQSFFDKNGNETHVKLLKPSLISFTDDTNAFISKTQYRKDDKTLLTVTTTRKNIGIKQAIYNGHEIKCLRSDVTQTYEYSSIKYPHNSNKVKSTGYILSGDNIGAFYMSFFAMGDTMEIELIETMSIEEFQSEQEKL